MFDRFGSGLRAPLWVGKGSKADIGRSRRDVRFVPIADIRGVLALYADTISKVDPAELLIAALSACHQLWYLHLCADAGIVVVAYSDDASGVEIEQADCTGQFRHSNPEPLMSALGQKRTSRPVCAMSALVRAW